MATGLANQASATSSADGAAQQLQERLSDPRIADGLNRLLDRVDTIAFAIEAFEGFVARGEVITNSLASAVSEIKTAERQAGATGQLDALINQAPGLFNTGAKLASVSQQAHLDDLEQSKLVQRLTEPETLAILNSLLDKLPLVAMMIEALDGFLRRGDTIAENVAGIVHELKLGEKNFDADKLVDFLKTLPKLQEMGEHLLNSGLADDGLPKVIDAGVSVINSGMLDKEVVTTLGEVGRKAIHTFLEVKQQKPAPIGGLWATLRASKDPDVQKSVGFFLCFCESVCQTFGLSKMHELSIANSLVELVKQQIGSDELTNVRALKLHVGALSCVHPDSLKFSFGLITDGTSLSGAVLEIETVPVSIYCPHCDSTEQLEGIQSFRCPRCQRASADIRTGRELELHSIEMESVPTQELPCS